MLSLNRTVGAVYVALAFALASAAPAGAACIPASLPTPPPRDPVALVLAQQQVCPKTPIAFRAILKKAGARLEPTMVNFAGFHNAASGAFFIFESATAAGGTVPAGLTIQRGDLLFGHFTATIGNRLVSNTEDLSIELITWGLVDDVETRLRRLGCTERRDVRLCAFRSCVVSIVRGVRLQADLLAVRLKPDPTYE